MNFPLYNAIKLPGQPPELPGLRPILVAGVNVLWRNAQPRLDPKEVAALVQQAIKQDCWDVCDQPFIGVEPLWAETQRFMATA